MTGHLLGGAGALEGIFTILAVNKRIAPPTINTTEVDADIEIVITKDGPRELPQGDIAALNNSFGFGGHNVAVLIQSA
jgi:3-oxoacyl-[acyl-carrier-protein] synthase II